MNAWRIEERNCCSWNVRVRVVVGLNPKWIEIRSEELVQGVINRCHVAQKYMFEIDFGFK